MFVHSLAPDRSRYVDALYREHARTVARFAAKLAGPGHEIDDVVQEVFVVASERLGQFRGEADIRTWLYAITRNIVRHRRRSAHRARRHLALAPAERTEPTPEELLVRHQTCAAVNDAVASLDEKYQTTLVLHAVDGLTGPQIAERTGVEPATVWVRLHRARHLIKAALLKGAIIFILAAAGTAVAIELLGRKDPPPPATNEHGLFRRKDPSMKSLYLAAALVVPAVAKAEEPPKKPPEVVYQAKTVYDFSSVKVTGEITRPDGVYVHARGKTNFRMLIKIRDDFTPELLKSVEEL